MCYVILFECILFLRSRSRSRRRSRTRSRSRSRSRHSRSRSRRRSYTRSRSRSRSRSDSKSSRGKSRSRSKSPRESKSKSRSKSKWTGNSHRYQSMLVLKWYLGLCICFVAVCHQAVRLDSVIVVISIGYLTTAVCLLGHMSHKYDTIWTGKDQWYQWQYIKWIRSDSRIKYLVGRLCYRVSRIFCSCRSHLTFWLWWVTNAAGSMLGTYQY